MIEFTSEDPFHSSYYYLTILLYSGIYILIQLIVELYKKKSTSYRTRKLSHSLDEDKIYPDAFIKSKNYLKFKYLLAYVLTRACIWAKSPYMYTLYNKYHGFTVSEIGVLYVIDAVSGLISGPILGSLADKFGRKLFCMNYCVLVVANLSLRLTGNKPLAYLAQILTGLGSGLINTTFESWVVYESRKVFEGREIENEKFLRRLFKNQNLYDAILSLAVSGLSAMVYTLFGIIFTIVLSMLYSIIAFFVILFLWDENKPNSDQIGNRDKNKSSSSLSSSSFTEALSELKKRDVLSIGIIESLFQASLNLFIFSWTPLLQKSTNYSEINIGFIFVCYVLMMIIGTAVFELVIITMKCKYYPSMIFALFIDMLMWCLIYVVDSFILRMIFLSIINGLCGFYLPLNSIIKSKILVEKHRATLMSIFRVPVNAYVIITLLSLKYMDAFTICIIASGMMTISFLLALSLYIFPTKSLKPETKDSNGELFELQIDEDQEIKKNFEEYLNLNTNENKKDE